MYRVELFSRKLLEFAAAACVLTAVVSSAHADTISFNFNSLSDGASNTSIQNYMQTVLAGNGLGTVAVTGAKAERNYTGDNHVVGNTYKINRKNRTYSNTLGTSDSAAGPLDGQRNPTQQGYYDTFLINDNFYPTRADRITMIFTLPDGFQIDAVSFDYEIFPNASCPGGKGRSRCSSVPDFTFAADDAVKLAKLASKPGRPDNNSPLSKSEKAWQFIGVSGLIDIDDTDNVTKLEFIDWPALIGIDNLSIDYYNPPRRQQAVPEPSTLLLLGLGLLGLAKKLSKRTKK